MYITLCIFLLFSIYLFFIIVDVLFLMYYVFLSCDFFFQTIPYIRANCKKLISSIQLSSLKVFCVQRHIFSIEIIKFNSTFIWAYTCVWKRFWNWLAFNFTFFSSKQKECFYHGNQFITLPVSQHHITFSEVSKKFYLLTLRYFWKIVLHRWASFC